MEKKKKERTKENNEREANGSRREEEKKNKREEKRREKKGGNFWCFDGEIVNTLAQVWACYQTGQHPLLQYLPHIRSKFFPTHLH